MEIKDTTNNSDYIPPETNIYVVTPPVDNNNNSMGRRFGKEILFAFTAFMIIIGGTIMLALAGASKYNCIEDCRSTFLLTDMSELEESECEISCSDMHKNQNDGGIALLVIGVVSLFADIAFLVWTSRRGGNYIG
ncbi:4529_t:CDS:1 [Paraglomus occultum]|uniref:4529_t:CDS:1 n=1 Tax=Paraglomus occultum TaxID=144539 RepID=A0A9N9CIQ9_9GLOM|nr:4529_t:CDS:1 [Paraglomus occultum]